MSTASKGKKYEREVCTRLRDKGLIAERIRGSGGGTGTRSGDILVVEPEYWPDKKHANETRGTDDQGLTIGRALEQGIVDDEYVYDVEVKYQSGGFSRVYHEQWLRGMRAVCLWQDDVLSCGIEAFDSPVKLLNANIPTLEAGAADKPALTKRISKTLRGSGTAKAPDFLCVRRSKKTTGPVDWIVIWKCNS